MTGIERDARKCLANDRHLTPETCRERSRRAARYHDALVWLKVARLLERAAAAEAAS